MQELQGKVALVTGASKGIGAEIARALAGKGAAVAVNYSASKRDAENLVAEINAAEINANGVRAIAVQADLSDPATVAAMVQTVVAQLGLIDILVNNAGVYEFRPLDQGYARALPQNVQPECSGIVAGDERSRRALQSQGR
jgi:3-oxoacyl-[acyl-carrier protein] reductase